jgi:Tol biopolymer transport system component
LDGMFDASGRRFLFSSLASNLVVGDSNDKWDVFIRDLETNAVSRLSTNAQGEEANGNSYARDLSADGRYALFASDADNLVPNDTNRSCDIFRRDLVSTEVVRVSGSSNGDQGNGFCLSAAISSDGRFVAFTSNADNLVEGDTNNRADVFVRDLTSGTIRIASVAESWRQSSNDATQASISADGRFVAFSAGSDLAVPGAFDVYRTTYVKDMLLNQLTSVPVPVLPNQPLPIPSSQPQISRDGRYVLFLSGSGALVLGDTNALDDIFVRDLFAGGTVRVSVSASGEQTNEASGTAFTNISNNGLVPIVSSANNLAAGSDGRESRLYVAAIPGFQASEQVFRSGFE